MKIFITGIPGFVSQNLRPYLAQDFDKAYSELKIRLD
jgi:nucleoside-diphosphate-sugar epimerase